MNGTYFVFAILASFTIVRVVVYAYAFSQTSILRKLYVLFQTGAGLVYLFLWITWLKIVKRLKKTFFV